MMAGVAWVARYADAGGGRQMDELITSVIGPTDEDIGSGTQFLILIGAASA
ncbi:MAG: hypothetical protein ABJQ70_01700 [Roseobacter sp.]